MINMQKVPTRDEALQLLHQYTKTDYLIKHALTVEGVMRHFAELLGEEQVGKWAIVGLLHDLDYEMFPDEHCIKVQEILRENNYPEDYIHAIVSHGYGMVCDVKPEHRMEKVLYALDELTGLIHAAVIMRPSKSVMDIEVKSVKKKFKSPSFAAGVSRETITDGLAMLGFELDYAIDETIKAMRNIADEIGLA